MNVEQRLREDLHVVEGPPELVPPEGLADTALAGARRQRRTRVAVVGVTAVVAALAAVAVPAVYERAGPVPAASPSVTAPGEPPVFPRPGGGPVAIHGYANPDNFTDSYVLDERTGRHRHLKGEELVLSPDGTKAAWLRQDWSGIVDRKAFAAGRKSEPLYRFDARQVTGVTWSPDGTAVLFTTFRRGSDGVESTAHRYDLASGKLTATPVGRIVGTAVGWTADSQRYVVLRFDGAGSPGQVEILNRDGSPYRRLDVGTGVIGGAQSYSPDGRRVILDAWGLDSDKRQTSKILDTRTMRPTMSLPANWRPLGWYDDDTLIGGRADRDGGLILELRELASGEITKTIPAPGLSYRGRLQFGSSTKLGEQSADLGF